MPAESRRIHTTRLRAAVLAVITIGVGLAVHRGGIVGDADVRDILGDALWAAMIFWWVTVLAPITSRGVRGGAALAVCVLVEISQLMHTPALDAVRATTLGHLVLGSGFDARDLLSYTMGVVVAMLVDRRLPT